MINLHKEMHIRTKKTGYDNGGKTDQDFTLDTSGKGLLKLYSKLYSSSYMKTDFIDLKVDSLPFRTS